MWNKSTHKLIGEGGALFCYPFILDHNIIEHVQFDLWVQRVDIEIRERNGKILEQ